jgi:hypothetical protein
VAPKTLILCHNENMNGVYTLSWFWTFNDLDYNDLDYNDLDYNELDHNDHRHSIEIMHWNTKVSNVRLVKHD